MIAGDRPKYERSEMSARGVAAVLGGFAVVVAIAVVVIFYALHMLSAQDGVTQLPITPQQSTVLTPPGPNLQARPFEDLHAAQAREDALLNTYAWANPAHSAARIPITRAMTLVVGRSLDPAAQGSAR